MDVNVTGLLISTTGLIALAALMFSLTEFPRRILEAAMLDGRFKRLDLDATAWWLMAMLVVLQFVSVPLFILVAT